MNAQRNAGINKCDSCELKETLKREIEKTRKAQEHYWAQVRKVNGTLAKYTQKIEELDKKGEI